MPQDLTNECNTDSGNRFVAAGDMTWAYVAPDLCRYMALLVDNELNIAFCNKDKSDVKRRNTPRPPRSVYHTK